MGFVRGVLAVNIKSYVSLNIAISMHSLLHNLFFLPHYKGDTWFIIQFYILFQISFHR